MVKAGDVVTHLGGRLMVVVSVQKRTARCSWMQNNIRCVTSFPLKGLTVVPEGDRKAHLRVVR